MNDWLLEKLENSKQEAEERIEQHKEAVARLEKEIRLNENIAAADDYREDMSEEEMEQLRYETVALNDIKVWEKSKLEEAKQGESILEFKIRFRRHQCGKILC